MKITHKKPRHFVISVIIVALITATVISRAIIGGVVDQYQLAFSEWPMDLWITQCFMIALYTTVFTAMLSVPLWYFFLGESDPRQ
ncbi:DUF2534 family protein [Tatumella saanichensis]|uniref:DUF2534 family protein n=1 Tax=Tatumella saanichensis TaxID=480813 RepID=UPI0004A385D5|nr:DUF2534 family protein [Tatumella saanichensis]